MKKPSNYGSVRKEISNRSSNFFLSKKNNNFFVPTIVFSCERMKFSLQNVDNRWSSRVNSGIYWCVYTRWISLYFYLIRRVLGAFDTRWETRDKQDTRRSIGSTISWQALANITSNLISVSLLIDSGTAEQGWFRIVNDALLLGFIAAYVKTSRFVLLAGENCWRTVWFKGAVVSSRDRRVKSASIRCFSVRDNLSYLSFISSVLLRGDCVDPRFWLRWFWGKAIRDIFQSL